MAISYKLEDKHIVQLQILRDNFNAISYIISERLTGIFEEKKNYMKKCSLISNIGASTRIENAILTDMEIEWIDTEIKKGRQNNFAVCEKSIKDKLSKDKERSIEEVGGYRDCINLVFSMYKDFVLLRESDIKGFHRKLLEYYPKANYYIGNYKKHSNSVVQENYNTKKKITVLKTADPGVETETSMHELVSWYNETIKKEIWKVPVAVEFVFRFLAIHPFSDGNGRLSRLFFQLILLSSGESCFENVIPYIGLDRCIEQTRSEYYAVLRKCSNGNFKQNSKKYNYIPFLEYMISMLEKSLKNFNYYSTKYEQYKKLSKNALNIFEIFKGEPERALQTKDIVGILNIPRRTVIYSLNSLVDAEFLQKLGQGPSSRYRITF